MKKITGFMLALCAAWNAAFALAGENPPLPQVDSPVLITGFGQSQDTNNVNIICRRLKVNAEYKLDVPSAEIDWSKYKTLFAGLGCSSSVYCCAFDADSTAIVITRDGKYYSTIREGDLLWYLVKGENTERPLEQINIYKLEDDYIKNLVEPGRNPPVRITEPVEKLFERVLNTNFVPVVDDVDSFIGIITRKDILTYLFKKNDAGE